jgi:uncharacterized membrane protein YfcA
MPFELVLGAASFAAGAIASIAGFGIGSVITPLLALRVETKLAVAAVSIPHLAATVLRFWRLRRKIDRRLIFSFGLTSALGGLTGALINVYANSPALTYVLGGLLVFAGFMGLTGLSDRLRVEGAAAWVAGFLSGVLGGLVGNQGGIRSAAMLGFSVPKESFVATATAAALAVDLARMPIYVANEYRGIASIWPLVVVATLGALVGTLLGVRLLSWIPDAVFKRLVSLLILALGLFMLWN